MSKSYEEGYDAFWNWQTGHHPLSDNPYVSAEEEYDHAQWEAGWWDAKEVDDNILGS